MKKVETGKLADDSTPKKRRAALPGILLRAFAAVLFLPAVYGMLPAVVSAEVPVKFTYQGNLRQAGFLVNGQRSMVFRIYDSSTSASALWTSPAYNVSFSTGVFRVTLEPAALSDWQSGNLWLEMEIEGNRMSPREELTSSPYAINSLLHSGKRYTTSASAPASPNAGDLWMNTALNTLYFWNGTSWTSTAGSGTAHAATHSGGGLDAITSLGAYSITGDVTLSGGVSLRSAGQGVLVSTNLIVAGALNPSSDLNVGGAGYSVSFASSVSAGMYTGSGLYLSGSAGYAGNMLVISTGPSNVIRMTGAGDIYANKLHGDGSGLTGITAAGDNLGSHNAAMRLDMAGNQIVNVSSLTVTGKDAASGYSLWLSSGINMAGGTVNAGTGQIIGNGSQLTDLNASSLASGTVNDLRLSANVDLLDADQTVSGVKTFASSVTVTGAGGISASRQVLGAGVEISSEASAALGGGVRISSNVYIVGFSSAARYYGDGSGLTGITAAGDNLGDHTATQNILLGSHWLSGDGGGEGITVDAGGNVGVGLSGASARLEVKGVDTQNYSLAVGTGTAHQVVVSTSGAVGIGTENPVAQLDITGSESSGQYIAIFNSGTSPSAWLRNK